MFSATYDPGDNKLRLYAGGRLDPETYQRVRAAGFIWAPKQELFVAPMWTPSREDLLIELAGEIDDEDKSLVERSEERAERMENYSERRADDAERARAGVSAIADNIPFGQPILVGHHSEKHARKDAERIENGMRKAVKMWEQSKYWEDRAKGAIRHAKYKERPDVRARRIKGLEADLRKEEKTKKENRGLLNLWENVHDETKMKKKSGEPSTLMERAVFISNFEHLSRCFPLVDYPREAPASQYEGSMGLWSALDGGVITPGQAREIAIPAHLRMVAYCDRWILHINNRLTYERAMLGESGGTVTDRKGPEKGGGCRCWATPNVHGGWSYIQKVNKVSVTLLDNWGNGGGNFTRTIPFHDLKAIMTAAEIQTAKAEGRAVDLESGVGFVLHDNPAEKTAEQIEADLRQKWTADGVSEAQREAILADVTAKAQPGAQVGPFIIGEDPKTADDRFRAMRDQLKAGVKVISAPQLFPTPPEIVQQMIYHAALHKYPAQRILEPSAGTGNILDGLRPWIGAAEIVAVEINLSLVDALRDRFREGIAFQCADFLNFNGDLGKFDRIIMNPPFTMGADIKHIRHAETMLAPGGRLVALCAAGPRQHAEFADRVDAWIPLPEGSFKAEGTGVNVALLVIDRPAEAKTFDGGLF